MSRVPDRRLLLFFAGALVACSDAAPLGDSGAPVAAGEDDPLDETDDEGAPAAEVVLNEVVSKRADGGPDWIELHNRGAEDVALTGWAIGDDPEGEGWLFPADAVIAADGLLLVFASDGAEGEPGELHADFKLSGDGETVLLWTAQGTVADEVAFPALEEDESYAREADGETWAVTAPPTAGAPNG